MPRGHHHGRAQIPVPPNDTYNKFFPNDDCGKYVLRRYNSQTHYTQEECYTFVKHINANYVLNPCVWLAPISGGVVILLGVFLSFKMPLIVVGIILLPLGFILLIGCYDHK